MTRRRRPYQRKPCVPIAPLLKSWHELSSANQGFCLAFRKWLYATGYSLSSVNVCGLTTRLAFGVLNKPYWQIDPEVDLQIVREYVIAQYDQVETRNYYFKGLAKLAQYLRLRYHQPKPAPAIHWAYYLGPLPAWLGETVRDYLSYRQRNWRPEQQYRQALSTLSPLTGVLRWMATHAELTELADLTPKLWFAYLDARLAEGLKARSLNSQLSCLHAWLYWLAEQGEPVCQRLLQVKPLAEGPHLPRDVPAEQLRQLWQELQHLVQSPRGNLRRLGLLDQVWFLLMLHSGFRVSEVRHLRLSDLDWERRLARIEQSKGLKDRLVPLSEATITALKAYLDVRGPVEALPDQLLIFRHAPLSLSYCYERLQDLAEKCGVRATPHQLRHSCATLLLNAGAPVLTVQTILGHKHTHTTLGYARLYDGTVAADYYRAMAQVENRLNLAENAAISPPSYGELVALVDSLRSGTLNEQQAEVVRTLRVGILALADQETSNNGPAIP